jgi:hypothetical protein
MLIETRRQIWSWLCWAGTGLLIAYKDGLAKFLPSWGDELLIGGGLFLFILGGLFAPKHWWGRWRWTAPLKEPDHEVHVARQDVPADVEHRRQMP